MEISETVPPSEGWAALAQQFAAHHRAMAARQARDKPAAADTASETEGRSGAPARARDSATPRLGLSEAEQRMVADLRARDREVRAHEQAHARVGGQFAGQPSYTFQAGPDGQRYAVGGEVPIDASAVPGDPEATVAKMEVVKAAALAPAEPSSADRKVAAMADATRARALGDLMALRQQDRDGTLDKRV